MMRKVSQRKFVPSVQFGIIDCAVYGKLCRMVLQKLLEFVIIIILNYNLSFLLNIKQYNINSFPTVLMYNNNTQEPSQYYGTSYQEEQDLVDFIEV